LVQFIGFSPNWKQDHVMDAANASGTAVKMFDCVSVDGRRGTAVGFYARDERTVLIRLDVAGLIEVPESQIVIENPRIASGWSDDRRNDEAAGRARHDALTRTVALGTSRIELR
jgi:hypothetical protein